MRPLVKYIRYRRCFFIASEFDVKRYARQDAEKTVLRGLCASTVLTVLEIDEVGIITVIDVVDAEDPLCRVLLVLLTPDGAHVKVVIVGGTIAIALSVVVDPIVF